VTFAEKALPQSACGSTIEDGGCGRFVVEGRLTPVPQQNVSLALEYLYTKKPFMKVWEMTHGFVPFWLAPENITDMYYVNQDGPQEMKTQITIDEYLAAPWERPTSLALRDVAKPAPGYHPRPRFWHGPELARWLVHEAEFTVVGSHASNKVGLESTAVSISDGDGYQNSTGLITMYLSPAQQLYANVQKDNRVSLTWTEMSIGNATAPGCTGNTAESPGCARLTIAGRLTKVPEANKSAALAQLFHRHPEMKSWNSQVRPSQPFEPFWIAPQDLDEFFLVPMYGGSVHFTPQTWFNSTWYRGGPLPGPQPIVPTHEKLACSVCGHVFNAGADAHGTAFEDLPASWKCPVCGSPKSAFRNITLEDASVAWVQVGQKEIIV
jgi:rubredoxin